MRYRPGSKIEDRRIHPHEVVVMQAAANHQHEGWTLRLYCHECRWRGEVLDPWDETLGEPRFVG